MERRIYIEGDGCNRRLLETSKFRRYLEANGYRIVNAPDRSNYILLVTCAFKEKEEDWSVSRLRALRKYDSKLLVYGCLPDIAPHRFDEFRDLKQLAPKNLDKIDAFFDDIRVKYSEVPESNVMDHLNGGGWFQTLKRKLLSRDVFTKEFYARASLAGRKFFRERILKTGREYYLFVSRGCLGECSYCAIRRSIGRVKSKPVETVVEEFRKGFLERYDNFSILADDPGCYGIDLGATLPDLLSALFGECDRLRDSKDPARSHSREPSFHIKEIHPKYILLYEKKLLELFESRRVRSILCPIQSGSDRILELMRRQHTAGEIGKALKGIRDVNPGIELTTQAIVGFPTETEEEFRQTLDLVKDVRFDSIVLFPYHDKRGTPAWDLENKTPETVIRKRLKAARKDLGKAGIQVFSKCPL